MAAMSVEGTRAAIEVRGLRKSFGAIEAVRGIDLEVAQAEVFGFLGPNGAGKTTTIKVLCTLLAPSSGAARVAGFDVVREPARVRRAIGVIFQDPSLDERLTARENLTLHAVAYGVSRRERAARIDQVLELVELSDRGRDLVRTFSGGMKRRLEIARGLLHRPRVLFLDEPTTDLDPQTRTRTWEVLRGLRERFDVTLFLTTHYMEEAEVCERIAIIDHGRIVALDTPEALKRSVGRDVVHVRTDRPEELARLLRSRYGLEVAATADGLSFSVEDGEAFVVRLLSEDKPPLSGIGVRRPTLEDVFLALTGHGIRDEAGEGGQAWRRMVARTRR